MKNHLKVITLTYSTYEWLQFILSKEFLPCKNEKRERAGSSLFGFKKSLATKNLPKRYGGFEIEILQLSISLS